MNANTAVATVTAAATIAIGSSLVPLPDGMGLADRVNAKNVTLGSRLVFIGTKDAKTLRADGKAAGLKGKNLDEYVNKNLRGDLGAAAWLRHDAIMSGLRSAGAVPTHLDTNKAGNKFKAEYTIAPDDSAKVAAEAAAAVAEKEATIAALEARLAELEAAVTAKV